MNSDELMPFPIFQQLKKTILFEDCMKDQLWRDILSVHEEDDVKCVHVYEDWLFIVEIIEEEEQVWLVPFPHMHYHAYTYENAEEALYDMYKDGPFW